MRKCLVFLILLLILINLSIDNALCQTEREQWQPPEQIMDSIGVKPGMIIGEPGAGSGYFTFHLSKRVGEKGKVYANDISRSSLNEIEIRAKREGINNIVTVLRIAPGIAQMSAKDSLETDRIANVRISIRITHTGVTAK